MSLKINVDCFHFRLLSQHMCKICNNRCQNRWHTDEQLANKSRALKPAEKDNYNRIKQLKHQA